MASLDYYMPNWQMGSRKPQAAKKPGLLAGMAAGPKVRSQYPIQAGPQTAPPMQQGQVVPMQMMASLSPPHVPMMPGPDTTGPQMVPAQLPPRTPFQPVPPTSYPMAEGTPFTRNYPPENMPVASDGSSPHIAASYPNYSVANDLNTQPQMPPASTGYQNYTGGADANGNPRAGIPTRDTVVSGAVNGRLAQIMLDQAQRQNDFQQGVKESLQQRDALHQEFSDSLPYMIEHGIAPHQVRGQSQDYVDMAREEAQNMNGRFQVTPTVRGETGMVQHAPNMPGWLAEQVARQKAQEQRNANWSSSKDTSLPGQDPTVINVSPGDVNPTEYQTADGYNAAQSRSIQQDPNYQAQLAAHKAYLAARANGQDAAAPPPLRINKQQPSGDMMKYVNGVPQKYSDYKAGLADKREGRLAKEIGRAHV